jgi:4-diphosphocytidyl-2-C-methyl-D-erythritol kinase
MVVFPPCKINLGLNIISKRPDGFHNIETCFYPVPLTDILEIIPAPEFSFSQTGLQLDSQGSDNLCVRAYQLLGRDYVIPPVAMHLHKIIPAGAGLGGGSSDAAYVLRLLNEIFELGISNATLLQYAARLGSDCAFFLHNSPMLGKGKGEILTPISVTLKGFYLVLVKPDIHIATADAYRGVTPHPPAESISEVLQAGIRSWRGRLLNDFEESVFRNYPELKKIKDKFYQQGVLYAGMSGSGSTVYGIFEKPVNLAAAFDGYFYWSGLL